MNTLVNYFYSMLEGKRYWGGGNRRRGKKGGNEGYSVERHPQVTVLNNELRLEERYSWIFNGGEVQAEEQLEQRPVCCLVLSVLPATRPDSDATFLVESNPNSVF